MSSTLAAIATPAPDRYLINVHSTGWSETPFPLCDTEEDVDDVKPHQHVTHDFMTTD